MERAILLTFGMLVVLFSGEVTSESEVCDILYNAAIIARDDVMRNPVVKELYGDDIDRIEEQVKQMLSISSVDNNTEIRSVACKIAGFTKMEELANMFNIGTEELRGALEQLDRHVDEVKTIMEQYKNQLKIVQEWIQKSKYPDTWPLNTKRKEVKYMLDNAHDMAMEVVFAYTVWGVDDKKLIRILTKSKSFKQFAEKLEQQPESLEARLNVAKALQDKNKMLQMFKVMDAYVGGLVAIQSSGLSKLP